MKQTTKAALKTELTDTQTLALAKHARKSHSKINSEINRDHGRPGSTPHDGLIAFLVFVCLPVAAITFALCIEWFSW